MAGLFEQANELVVLDGTRTLEWSAQPGDPTVAPVDTTDGVALSNTSNVVVALSDMPAGETMDLIVRLFPKSASNAPQEWIFVNGGEFEAVDDKGMLIRAFVGGFSRVHVQILNKSGGGANPTVSIGKAIK